MDAVEPKPDDVMAVEFVLGTPDPPNNNVSAGCRNWRMRTGAINVTNNERFTGARGGSSPIGNIPRLHCCLRADQCMPWLKAA